MNEHQLDLFPPASNATTSLDAAEEIQASVETLRAAVLAYIRARPDGATDQEIEYALGMSGNTVRPRRGELQARGLIEDSGTTRLTKSGRKAIVWRAKK